jgi:hypothetical protein
MCCSNLLILNEPEALCIFTLKWTRISKTEVRKSAIITPELMTGSSKFLSWVHLWIKILIFLEYLKRGHGEAWARHI